MLCTNTNRVLKEQSMVVRRTDKIEQGLGTDWSEDGTTTTYLPYVRSAPPPPPPRRVDRRPAQPMFQTGALTPALAGAASGTRPLRQTANMYAHAQPSRSAPARLELGVDDLDNPFARPRGAASASFWNVLGFAALFCGVLLGRVIVHSGLSNARAASTPAVAAPAQPPAPQPAADSATTDGTAGVAATAPETHRNEAAVAPEAAQPATDKAEEAPQLPAAEAPSEPAAPPPSAAPSDGAQPIAAEPNAPSKRAAHATRTREPRAQAESLDWRREAPEAETPAPAAASSNAAPGMLRINSRPWSQVFLDGRLIGNTPQMGVSVPAGRYQVRLSNPELGMTKSFTVHVAAGEQVTRVETLDEP
jgi:hypothetical protein